MSTTQINDESKTKGFMALFLAAFIYSTFGVLIRLVSPMFGDNFQVAVRFFLAFLIIVVFNIIRKNSMKLPRNVLIKIIILGIAFSFVVLLFTIAVLNTTLANSVFLLYAGSLTSAFLIGTFIFKEKVTITKVTAILLAFIGVSMYANAIFALSLGVIAGFGSGLFDGLQNSLRRTLKGVDRNLVLQYSFLSGMLCMLLASFLSGEQIIKSISFVPIIAIILFSVLITILGKLLLYGFHHFDLNIGTVILSMELVFATIFGIMFYKEVPTAKEIVGGVFIFIASVLSAIDTKALYLTLRNKINDIKTNM